MTRSITIAIFFIVILLHSCKEIELSKNEIAILALKEMLQDLNSFAENHKVSSISCPDTILMKISDSLVLDSNDRFRTTYRIKRAGIKTNEITWSLPNVDSLVKSEEYDFVQPTKHIGVTTVGGYARTKTECKDDYIICSICGVFFTSTNHVGVSYKLIFLYDEFEPIFHTVIFEYSNNDLKKIFDSNG